MTGGRAPGGELARGAYYQPTLVTGAPQASEMVQRRDLRPRPGGRSRSTATTRACGWRTTPPTVWPPRPGPRDVYRAGRASREIRAGCVWVNDHIPIISEMPHGGYGASGFGKDMSMYSFEEYTQVKHVMYDNTAVARKDWHRTIFRDR